MSNVSLATSPLVVVVMPALNETVIDSPSGPSTGAAIALRSVSITATASSSPWRSSHRTTNSSPPSRATVSVAWTFSRSRRATSPSTSSPAACPSVSLTTLNLKRFRSSDQVIIGIFAGFALLALLLAATGLYGLITYTVGQRTGEFGTRFALGARPADVLWLVVAQVARLLGVGLAAGLAGGLTIGYGMRSVLYGVSSVDPTTLVGVVTLMAVIAVIASLRPALRAARVNLVDALRAE